VAEWQRASLEKAFYPKGFSENRRKPANLFAKKGSSKTSSLRMQGLPAS